MNKFCNSHQANAILTPRLSERVRMKTTLMNTMRRHYCSYGRAAIRTRYFSLDLTNHGSCNAGSQIPSLVSSIREQLRHAESQGKHTKGCVLVTTADGESCPVFGCWSAMNAHGAADSGSDEAQRNRFLDTIDLFKPVVADLISLPMPTIATLNGPSTVAGLLLSLSHDYLIMKPGITSILSDESSEDLSLPPFFEALIRSKALGSAFPRSNLVLRDLKFDDARAAEIGFVDRKNEVEEDAVELAKTMARDLADEKWNGRVYAELRKALHPELCKKLGLNCETILPKLKK